LKSRKLRVATKRFEQIVVCCRVGNGYFRLALRFPMGFDHAADLEWPSFSIFDARLGTPASKELRLRLTPVSGSFFGVANAGVAVADDEDAVRDRMGHRGCVTDAGVLRDLRTRTLPASGVFPASAGRREVAAGSARRVFVTAGESTETLFLPEASTALDERRCRPPPGVTSADTLLACDGSFSESLWSPK
jgi:hypothetical protein